MPTALAPLRWQAFHLPKRGNSDAEYEDAFAGSTERSRFAVADGASESSFSGLWAKLLTEGFVREAKNPWKEMSWLEPLRARWAEEVGRRPMPWYAEMKRQEGAFATFLGVAFRQQGYWRGVAVGDSCVMQLRSGRLITSFPLKHSADFGNQPALISSRPVAGGGRKLPLHQLTGRWEPGDWFLLMTDAIAQWFLAEHEENRSPWKVLLPLLAAKDPLAQFSALIADLRERNEMRNDDVTLLITDAPAETSSNNRAH